VSELLNFVLGFILECVIGWTEKFEYQRFFACFLLSIAAAALTSAVLCTERWHLLVWVPLVLAGVVSGVLWENHQGRSKRSKWILLTVEPRKQTKGIRQWPQSPLI
jgi:hypothetical protein